MPEISNDSLVTPESYIPAHSDKKGVYFSQLDGLRFIAAFLVMIQHWITNRIGIPAPLGFAGVTLFFVLSGFLISRILITQKSILLTTGGSSSKYFTDFYIRRILRIFPLYFLVVFLLYLFDFGNVRESILWLLTHTINIKFALQGFYDTWTNHLWSLAIEEQFYLIYPFLLFIVPQKHYVKMLVTLVVSSIIFKLILTLTGVTYRSIGFYTISAFDSFGLGGLLAYAYIYQRDKMERWIRSYATILLLVTLTTIAIAIRIHLGQNDSYQIVWFRFLVSILSVWVIGSAILGFTGIIGAFLEHHWVSYLGRISYGLYVYHNFANYLTAEFIGKSFSHSPLLFPLYFIATVLVASLSWHFYEHPINRLKDRFTPSTH